MHWQWNEYSLILALAAVASAGVAALAWRYRHERGGTEFAVLMGAGGAVWAAGSALEVLSPTLGGKLAFLTVGYVGTNVVPVALLVFAVVYTDRRRWATRRNAALLGIPPLLVSAVAAPANALGLHDLIWREVGLGRVGALVFLERSFGPLYWATTTYNYALVAIALALFGLMAVEGRGRTRKQGLALLAGSLVPLGANLLWLGGMTRFDYTPAAFTVTGVVFAVAIFRYGLLDLAPVARDAVLEDIEDGYVVVDSRDRVVDLNDTARSIALAETPVGRPIGEVLPPAETVLEGAPPDEELRAEIEVEAPDPRQFEVRADPLVRNRFRGRLLFLRDVTARRAVERRYRALIENASDLIAVLDEEGRFTYHSPSVEQILGYDPEALVGRPATELFHPDDEAHLTAAFERILAGEPGPASIEHRVRRADGEWIWLESRAKNLLDDPAVEGVVINSRDVSDRLHHERALERKNERLDEFASVVSHDLRNPLMNLDGRLDLARETGEAEHFDSMQRAVDRMKALVDDLLVLAREGEVVGETSPTSIATVANAAWDSVSSGDATLEVVEDVEVEADPDRLHSLLANLFSNAIEHAGPPVSVRVGACEGGYYVEDDGPGVPLEDREQVFTRGVSGSPAGTGFGLSIVRSIAGAHGWEVDLVEGSDGGARFEFTTGPSP